MNGVETAKSLHGKHRRVVRRERPTRFSQLTKIRSLDELPHHVAGTFIERREVVKRRDVRVLNLRRQSRFTQEALVRARFILDLRPHQLDDTDSVQMYVEDFEDLSHPADAEARENLILAINRM